MLKLREPPLNYYAPQQAIFDAVFLRARVIRPTKPFWVLFAGTYAAWASAFAIAIAGMPLQMTVDLLAISAVAATVLLAAYALTDRRWGLFLATLPSILLASVLLFSASHALLDVEFDHRMKATEADNGALDASSRGWKL